ncbi:MAG TPA: dienelactone hydrolase family protein, partial [Gemmataceae bacterium]
EGRHPTILLLHGADGMRDALIYQCLAKQLVQQGYVTLIAHYFERTETERIKPKAIEEKLFVAWRETVRQAVLYAAGLPEVDRRRIGLLGFSLGAYLSLAVAAQADVPVAAVADFFGGLPKKLHANAKGLPPVLIVHGDKDKTVPVEEALDLEKLLRQHKRIYEKKIYEKQEHLFGGHYLDADARDAWERTLTFFGKYLQLPRAVWAP